MLDTGVEIMELIHSGLYSLRIEIVSMLAFGVAWVAGRWLNHRKKAHLRSLQKTTPSPLPRRSSAGFERSSPEKLCDIHWLLPQINNLCRFQVQRAFDMYRAAVKAGLCTENLPHEECRQLFTALVTAAIRVGQTEHAIGFVQELCRTGPGADEALLSSATKLCTSKQLFEGCLTIYDIVMESREMDIQDKSLWSCFLFCAVETKAFNRCKMFFDRLCACGTPATKDYGNMVRFASHTNDWRFALDLIQDMQKTSTQIDSVTYNTVLAACVSADQLDRARQLLDDMLAAGGVADVITYNTLAKGFAKTGQMDKCSELVRFMRSREIHPSKVTYGILLDGFINCNEFGKAIEIYNIMKEEGCQMNTVLYTTLIKGFARAGQVDMAHEIYDQMRREKSMQPDVITFSILIKANCDAGRLQVALKLLAIMKESGLQPDEVVFNNLLSGCIIANDMDLAKHLYKNMLASHVKPTTATFSILLRIYAQCHMWDEAHDLLKTELHAQRVLAEPRLYTQLAQCCLRERQGRRAVDAYKLLAETAKPTAAMNSILLCTCAKLNMLDTGVEIMELAAQANSRVDARDAATMLEAALKKRKKQVVDSVKDAMLKLNLPVHA
eukprot:TRINITY_DN1099_c0_g3_i1.p1 TRINITY_DN1099_c0_g3~~TRINITY_DN1099_c0_g3_i1.p1  ORF type:complete len:611 (+),score=125.58 TRINITY_DN1099_c0_g3_i1:124-1956(+)